MLAVNPKSIEVVVVHYQDNLSWIKYIDHPIIVYNKNDVVPKVDVKKIVSLDNVGKESHAYIYHIIKNYYSLPDITIFSQGWPFDHCRDFIKIANCRSIRKMNNMAMKLFDHEFLINNEEFCSFGSCFAHDGIDMDWNFQWVLPHAAIALNIMLPKNVPPRNAMYCKGAILAMSKNCIQKFTIEQYKKLYKMHYDFWSMPWAMERIWYHIYNEPNSITYL